MSQTSKVWVQGLAEDMETQLTGLSPLRWGETCFPPRPVPAAVTMLPGVMYVSASFFRVTCGLWG